MFLSHPACIVIPLVWKSLMLAFPSPLSGWSIRSTHAHLGKSFLSLRAPGCAFLVVTSHWGPRPVPVSTHIVSVKKWADWMHLYQRIGTCKGVVLVKVLSRKVTWQLPCLHFWIMADGKVGVCIAKWTWMSWAVFKTIISFVLTSLICWMTFQSFHWRNDLSEHVTNWFAFLVSYISLFPLGGDAIWGSWHVCVFRMVGLIVLVLFFLFFCRNLAPQTSG